MAKFISIKSVGAGIEGGDILLSGDKCLGVVVSSTTNVNYHLAGGVGSDVASITYTGGAALGVKLRENINYALTANPGGVKAKVQLPSGISISGIAIA